MAIPNNTFSQTITIDKDFQKMTSSFQINSLSKGIYDNEALHVYRPHGRQDYHILYVKQGSITLLLNGNHKKLKAGQAVFFPPNVQQEYIQQNCITFYCHFGGLFINQICLDLDLIKPAIFNTRNHNNFEHLFLAAIENFIIKTTTNKIVAQSYILRLISELSASLDQGYSTPASNYTKKISSIALQIQTDATSKVPFDLKKYANMMFLSESRFSHLFKSVMNLPPLKFYNQALIEKACQLLSSSNMKIKEIAYSLNFLNELYFTTFFKKYTGYSPSQYRALSQAKNDGNFKNKEKIIEHVSDE